MDRVERAALFAIKAHEGQVRKISKEHYFFHPLEVAYHASIMTKDEDVIIAALLHDTIEEGHVSPMEIEKEFGKKVKELVLAETENEYPDLSREESWKLRKEDAIKRLHNATDINVKILYLADKLSNIKSLYDTYLNEGDKAFNYFHVKDKSLHEWFYFSILNEISELKNTAPYREYKEKIEKIFKEV